MSQYHQDVRFAAQSLYNNMNRQYPSIDPGRSQSHSINLVSEDFLLGYMHEGRMSVVRRFFCLFVTFDLFFISLLWLICIVINGDNIYNALKLQILHYTIYTSLFDIVMAAICRFVVLLLFYACLYVNNWFIVALSTAATCAFITTKVFFYDWQASPQPVFQVLLIVVSFILAWGEAWFLDCRVIPQEQHARGFVTRDRTPSMAPFLTSMDRPPLESVANYYSPYDSIHNSDDEEDEKMEDYKNMAIDCVRKAYNLLESSEWKVEKVTATGDTIRCKNINKLGKVYRLTGHLKCPARELMEDLFYNIEKFVVWNPTILESKIIKTIDSCTDITYQATIGGGGGLVKSRDFVNLRCWQHFRNGKMSTPTPRLIDNTDYMPDGEGSVSTISNTNSEHENNTTSAMQKSTSLSIGHLSESTPLVGNTILSKSLGAQSFGADEETFIDAEQDQFIREENIYVNAGVSIDYPAIPPNPTKYTRGENLISCWAMREIDGKSDSCIFEWLLCIDLKGYFPRYVLDAAYTSLMQDYMVHLRKHCSTIRKKIRKRKVPIEEYSE